MKFIEAYKKEYNQEPGVFAALGYDAGLFLIDALKRANSTDPENPRSLRADQESAAEHRYDDCRPQP